MPLRALLLPILLLSSASASAQVIRGVVTDAISGTAVPGALVNLRSSSGSDTLAIIRRAVTNARGEYAIAAPGAGLYRLTVRRIGVREWNSAPFQLNVGETVVQDAVLDPFTTLPRITVADRSLCTTDRTRGARIAELWREAETALNVIAISSRDSSLSRRMVRFTRRMSAVNAEIIEETYHSYDERDGIGEPNFRSLSGDSLSTAGYWKDAANEMTFYAPDAQALLSTAFVRDHCFSLVDNRADRAGLVGLGFAPIRGRLTPDIRGTLWLNASTFELERVDFKWTQLPWELEHDRVGGEVRFTRLPTGAWIVKNWTLTMPRPSTIELRSTGSNRQRVVTDGLGQEGGMILVHGLEKFDTPGTVTGRVTRSGKPLLGTQVRLVGTPFQVAVDRDGRFRFDSVPPGLHAIVAEHPEFAAFNVRVAEQEFALQEGATRHLVFHAGGEKEIANAMCPGRDWRLPTLRLTLIDERTGQPLRKTPLRMRWLEVVPATHGSLLGKEARDADQNVTTDDVGRAVFCSLPAALTLTLGYPKDSGLVPLHTFKLGPQENAVATVRATPP
jgi:hypothetical protein